MKPTLEKFLGALDTLQSAAFHVDEAYEMLDPDEKFIVAQYSPIKNDLGTFHEEVQGWAETILDAAQPDLGHHIKSITKLGKVDILLLKNGAAITVDEQNGVRLFQSANHYAYAGTPKVLDSIPSATGRVVMAYPTTQDGHPIDVVRLEGIAILVLDGETLTHHYGVYKTAPTMSMTV